MDSCLFVAGLEKPVPEIGAAVQQYEAVMPGFMPGIHVFAATAARKNVDGRDKPGHDEWRGNVGVPIDAKTL